MRNKRKQATYLAAFDGRVFVVEAMNLGARQILEHTRQVFCTQPHYSHRFVVLEPLFLHGGLKHAESASRPHLLQALNAEWMHPIVISEEVNSTVESSTEFIAKEGQPRTFPFDRGKNTVDRMQLPFKCTRIEIGKQKPTHRPARSELKMVCWQMVGSCPLSAIS